MLLSFCAVIASVTAVLTAQDGKVTRRPLVGEKGAEASRVYRIPKAEAAKWKRIALLVDGAEGRKGEPGYALTERGLVFVNGRPMALDRLWKNGTSAQAYWLWRDHWKRVK